MSQIKTPRGTQDFLPDMSARYHWVENTALRIAKLYSFGEIKTPIFEHSEIFHRTLGETSDIVGKETYNFLDRGGDSLTLRPEGTAGVARAFISEGLAQKLPLRLFYSGPMFRYERPQKGRYRQFHQLGIELLGLESALADAEVLCMAHDFLLALGLNGKFTLNLNTLGDRESRSAYREELVKYFTKYRGELSADSQNRLEKNPLRILDSKDANDQKITVGAPKFNDFLNDSSLKFFQNLKEQLEKLEIPFVENPHLVRGIDYYCHTVFEFITQELGAQGTLLAGGRYDGLIETMGGPKTPGVGWASGTERLIELASSNIPKLEGPRLAIVFADEFGEKASLQIAHQLRNSGISTEIIFTGNIGKKMKKAASLEVEYVIILGENEIKSKLYALKNMSTGHQDVLALDEIIKRLS